MISDIFILDYEGLWCFCQLWSSLTYISSYDIKNFKIFAFYILKEDIDNQ